MVEVLDVCRDLLASSSDATVPLQEGCGSLTACLPSLDPEDLSRNCLPKIFDAIGACFPNDSNE